MNAIHVIDDNTDEAAKEVSVTALKNACAIFRDLSCRVKGEQDVDKSGGVAALLKTIADHLDDGELVLEAASAIRNTLVTFRDTAAPSQMAVEKCRVDPVQQIQDHIIVLGAVEVFAGAMERHSGNEEVSLSRHFF